MPAKNLEDIYQKKSQHEHILARPEMYIGPVEKDSDECWYVDEENAEGPVMKLEKLTWVPGLYKIFDEILVNAADNKVRDDSQTMIQVWIDEKEGKVRVWNNGEGIPIAMHKEHNLHIPEMIFGYLMTSSNYDDSESRVTGGRNGFGAKLTNVFSTRFELETCHTRSRKKFHMAWENNMYKANEAKIVHCESSDSDYTQVTFWPDFKRFGMTSFDNFEGEHIVRLMKRRVYDVAACTGLKVKLNGKTVPVRTFSDYVDLFPTFGEKRQKASYTRVNERWEICVRMSNIGYKQMSFVNSIATTRGGTHVNYITNQVIDKVISDIDKKKKDKDKKASRASGVKPFMIKPHLWIFINCQIENPSFDSQTKETLNTTKAKFGSDCALPQGLLDYIAKSGIVQRAVDTANSKIMREIQGKVKSTNNSFINVPKLEDASLAGTKRGYECTLILTEGDSAKSLAIAGVGAFPPSERAKWGVFPLRGKPLNVRDASMKKVLDCEEIQNLMKIVGLKVGTEYTDDNIEALRYGRIMIMSDQDHDGSHIKGLIVNFVHHFWPSLLKVRGFLQQFITPIVKAIPAKKRSVAGEFDEQVHNVQPMAFFSVPDFLEWKRNTPDAMLKRYTIKYFKGLGTSSSEEGRSYFNNITDHRIRFRRDGDNCENAIVKAFSKDKVDERKVWITNYSSSTHIPIDYKQRDMSYRDFIDKELILFSVADCERSIPSLIDGLKPGQRKVLYGCFKRNLRSEIKVAQLAGYVSEHSAYHHGEASLQATIIAMAQDFVGSNNLPVLRKSGQFGTRLMGGKDAAAARYIFTSLNPVTRAIFHPDDDAILDYKDDDGFPVEPQFYIPVIPMGLVNGTSGIGTGFATSVPNYNPLDIVTNLRRLIMGEEITPMDPWYYGFNGTITEKAKGKYITAGKHDIRYDNMIRITELPIGTWTNAYTKMLKEMKEKELLCEMHDLSSEEVVDVSLFLQPEVHETWVNESMLDSKLDLTDYIHATNIMFFNEDETLTKYPDPEAVLREFFLVRMKYYQKRKDHLIARLERDLGIAENKFRFITEVVNGTLNVMRKKRRVLLEELRERGYGSFPPVKDRFGKAEGANNANSAAGDDEGAGQEREEEVPENEQRSLAGYRYLLDMPIYTLTEEMLDKLARRAEQLRNDLRLQREIPIQKMWLNDLDNLEKQIGKYYEHREKENAKSHAKATRGHRDAHHISIPKKIAAMSDKARSAFQKEVEKKLPKERKAPKPKAAAKKKKKKRKGSDDDTESDFSSDLSESSMSPSDDDDKPLSERWAKAKEVKTPKPKPKPKAKSTAKAAKGSKSPSEAPPAKAKRTENTTEANVSKALADDDDWLNAFGIDALDAPPAAPKPVVAKTPAARPQLFDDEGDDDVLLMGGTTAPKPVAKKSPVAAKAAAKPSAKKAAPKRKRKDESSDDESEDSSSDDDSSDDSSDDSDDSDYWSD